MTRDLAALTSSSADWSGIRIDVAGIGIAGFAAADALLSVGADVTVLDAGDDEKRRDKAAVLETLGATVRLGCHDSAADDADAFVVSPGIRPRDPVIADALRRGIPVWGELEVACLHTPGHTPGSQCFYTNGCLISGDTLFLEGCGRTDLPGSNPGDMWDSLTLLAGLPDDTIVFPGHQYSAPPAAHLGEVKEVNYVFKPRSREAWMSMFGHD